MAEYYAAGVDAPIVEANGFVEAAEKIAIAVAQNWYGAGYFATVWHRESFTDDGTEETYKGEVGQKIRGKVKQSQDIHLSVVRLNESS